jgi:hypothetical protein
MNLPVSLGISHHGTLMDYYAYQLTKFSLLLLPFVWLILGAFAWFKGYQTSGILIVVAGLAGALWNFLFMPLDHSMPEQIYWRVIVFVEYEEAPLGHLLSVYLPLISKLALVSGFAVLLASNV